MSEIAASSPSREIKCVAALQHLANASGRAFEVIKYISTIEALQARGSGGSSSSESDAWPGAAVGVSGPARRRQQHGRAILPRCR